MTLRRYDIELMIISAKLSLAFAGPFSQPDEVNSTNIYFLISENLQKSGLEIFSLLFKTTSFQLSKI